VKRDPRLHGLSSDHHHALVLARRVAAGSVTADELRARFAEELEPHFVIEERVLLPALREVGAEELADRTLADHAAIRAAVASGALAEVADRVTAHVRFEERELFPACEERLPASALDALRR
jgi:iron-sulfur cluster repair protein YtfE (RIC family)